MDEFHQAAAELAGICREAINDHVWGGAAPHDSNILSEHWPAREGAAFTGEYRGFRFMAVIMPGNPYPQPGSPGYPDYSVLDADG